MITISDVEWMLSQQFDVYQRNGSLIVDLGDVTGYLRAADLGGTPVVTMTFMPAMDLQPSAGLYRWVAVRAHAQIVGSLSVDLNGDGLVDVFLAHSLFDSSLEPDDLQLVVSLLAQSARELRHEATQLFG